MKINLSAAPATVSTPPYHFILSVGVWPAIARWSFVYSRALMRLARFATSGAMGFFAVSVVSFVYIVLSFERLERFALDEVIKN
jgi:hypothetical protein